ncbi:MAG TPA: hypothetical protein VHW44_33420 [Pseudonocardiaceae bacterium]|jgi:hypothetical protein|nr:hypothetical protein [Pseudonocardiaceae bacterium]
MLTATGLTGHHREIASVALLAWLSFVRTICVEWLLDKAISRAEVRDVCLHALLGALGPIIEDAG